MILNCIRLSEDFGCDYKINWFPKGAAAPKLQNPEELFSDQFIQKHFISNDEVNSFKDQTASLSDFLADENAERLHYHLRSNGVVLVDEGFEVTSFPWEDHHVISARYPDFINRIEFNPFLQNKVDIIQASLKDEKNKSVAYHIRRGDILNEAPWKHGMWPAKIEVDEFYQAHLEFRNPGTALVFSDLESKIGKMRASNDSVKGISDLADITDCTPAQKDFLELFAMSRADTIVAPAISAFSSAAARLSGKERLRFVDVLKPEEQDQAYDELTARFEAGLENFANISEAAHHFSRLSRHLALNDREEEAYRIGKSLLDAGADNAFMPLLHAINCVYLSKWEEAKTSIKTALDSSDLWNEDFAICLALRSHIEAALGNAVKARQLWLRAFWLKPHLPDIVIIGSAMLERNRLRSGPSLPFDSKLLRQMRLKYLQRNTLTIQRKIIRQAPIDFFLLAIEWRECVLDRKSQKEFLSKDHLKSTRSALESLEKSPEKNSFVGLLQGLLGNFRVAENLTKDAMSERPDDFLITKRHAEVLWQMERVEQATHLFHQLIESHPENPFGYFLTANCLMRRDRFAEALPLYEKAASLDETTAAFHAGLAAAQIQEGRLGDASNSFATASKLAPTYQSFENQRSRLERKLK